MWIAGFESVSNDLFQSWFDIAEAVTVPRELDESKELVSGASI